MTGPLSILVRPTAWGERLRRSLESALAQTDPAVDVLVVDTGCPEPRARAAAAAYALTPGVRVVAAGDGPTAWLEVARAAAGAVVVPLAEGDVLNPDFCADARQAFEDDPALACVLAPAVMEPGFGPLLPEPPEAWSEEAVLGVTWCVPMALAIRRERFEAAVQGEAADALPPYAWLLGLLARGARATVLPRPGLLHAAGRDTAFRAALDPERYGRALDVLLGSHREQFERDPATVIFGRERLLRALVREHRARVARRDEHLARLQALVHECGRLRSWLEHEGRGAIDWGDFERTSPVSRTWGYDRGTPVDRYYIEQFVARHSADVRGNVLEVQENDLTLRFGGARVSRSDVIDWNPGNPRATIVDDLRRAVTVADGTYDCIILTQTLHVIDDMRAVLAQCARILKPGGVLLATLPCASRVCLEYGPRGDFWRVTEAGARVLFEEVFPAAGVQTTAFGNVKVAAAFLYGLALHEVDATALETVDPYFPLLIGVRAVKPVAHAGPVAAPARAGRERIRRAPEAGVILLYHRVARPASDVHGLSVSPEVFADQVAILRERFVPLPLRGFVDAAREGALPPGAVAVTFDDGYADVLEHALPILEAARVPVTCFVPSASVGAGRAFWWDVLEYALLGPHAVPVRLSLDPVGLAFEGETRTLADRQRVHGEIYRLLRRTPALARERAVAHILHWSGAETAAPDRGRPLTSVELQQLAAHPLVTIGAHGAYHLALPELDEAGQREEIETSKRTLEESLGRIVDAFAYPYGAWAPVTVTLVRDAGFACAVTCEEGPVQAGMDPWRLPRVEVRADAGAFFERRLRACLDRARWAAQVR